MESASRLSVFKLAVLLLKDPERKSVFRVMYELVRICLLYNEVPKHYFSRYLFKRDIANIADYLPGKLLYGVKARFNEKRAREVVENKLYFDFFYSQFKVAVPKIKIYNHRNVFVVERQQYQIKNVNDFKDLLDQQLKATPDQSLFIKKTYGSYGGANIFKISLKDMQNTSLIQGIYEEVIKTGYLFQEVVKQHSDLNAFNPSCLNTIRIDTFLDKDGNTEIISAYFKTNFKNSYIDNEVVGGCEISIDLATGMLEKYGHLTLKYNGLQIPTMHPVTKVVFENFQIPFFAEAKELVLKVAGLVPNLRLMGWDVAISDAGPVLIEGNSDYDISASDLAYGGYRSNPIFRKVLKEINLL